MLGWQRLLSIAWRKLNAGESDSMQNIKRHITLMCLAAVGLGLAGCGSDDKSSADSSTKTAASTMTKAAAGSNASQMVAPGDQIGASALAPQGDCPKGYACTRVLFPANERVCMKPGEALAPNCNDKGQCPDMPNADCVDTGTTGKICTQFCKVP
jgi:hypothetical protein